MTWGAGPAETPRVSRGCRASPGMAPLAGIGLAARRERRQEIESRLAAWARREDAEITAAMLRRFGIAAAALMSSVDLVHDLHLRERGFWDAHEKGVLPGLPWRSNIGRATGPAPGLGADTDAVLHEILGLPPEKIAALRHLGALG